MHKIYRLSDKNHREADLKITCGTDIVEIDRIKKAVAKSSSFLDRIYSSNEQDYCLSKKAGRFSSLAARFAAKEAVSKAMGTGLGEKASPLEIEVVNNHAGKPGIVLSGRTKESFEQMGAVKIEVSLSHGRDYAVAFAVITYREDIDE
ncbi:MAG: holo-ACP synthase [Clostridia bacterium]|nr:holo-ACP synthase [Clostridia bacterium]